MSTNPFRRWLGGALWIAPVMLAALFAPLTRPSPPRGRGTGEGESSRAQQPAKAGLHWAFVPIAKVAPPADADGWSAHPVDRFVRAKQRQRGLPATGTADMRVLIRRATFDLTGLPPTPEQVDAFVADTSKDAWARLVDRLLASEHYGERWARHWLDVVRYADTGGFEQDYFYPNAWRYRDYVIRSLNADKPFDRFIQEQVAGDELWSDDGAAVLATGMYCVGPALGESAMVANQLEYEWLTDAVDTTGAAFLGLTFGCARCHDHKSDPITQKDYFAMQAIFAASDRPYPARIRLQRIKALNGLLSEAPVPKKLEDDPRCTLRTDDPNGMWLFHRKEPMNIHRLHRGLLSKPREELKPAFPAVLSPGAARSSDRASAASFPDVPPSKRRSELARWLTAPENPLTARVLVNRAWAWHFGQGIVRTPSDFGVNGEPPSDQGLLDWLARDFIDNGWSLKHLHRRIMLSRTYQMSSVGQASAVKADPENRLLTHFQRRRLEGEAIRDHILACTGSLNRKQFGPAVVPPLSKEELTGLFGAKEKWPVTKDVAEHTRRSVYLLVRRTFGYPMLAAFDPPEVMTSCAKRTPTIVPTQALTLLNSPVAREQSLEFARRLVKECGDDQEKRLSRAWLLAFGRPITAPETKRALAFLDHRTGGLSGRPHEKQSPISPQVAALADLCLALFNSNEFTYID